MHSETDDEDHQRNRGPTFTSVETNLLLDLVEKHEQTILNPDTKAPSIKAKEQAWKLIQKELNSKINGDRTVDSLKNKWKNLKSLAKKTASVMELQCQEIEISRVNSILNTSTHGYDDNTDSEGSNPKRSRLYKFTPEEMKLLLECVRKEKKYIMSPDSNEEANSQKEQAWARVTEEFNSQNATPRTSRVLRKKFINMKHSIITKHKEIPKSEPDDDSKPLSDLKEEIKYIYNNGDGSDSMIPDTKADSADEKECNATDSDSSDDSNPKRSRHRSGNFTPEENKLLLKCVRGVKDIVLSSSIDHTSNLMRIKAWKKVTEDFNRQNSWRCTRSCKSLKQRFKTMKMLAKNKIAQQKAVTHSDTKKRIKEEPLTYEDIDMVEEAASQDEVLVQSAPEKSTFPTGATNVDPLDIVLNAPIINDYNLTEEFSEIAKKKLELLKYQMETAELERNRIFKLLKAEETEYQLRATETALRLRTARLEMAAAEAKLPSDHPALVFAPPEKLAHTYSQLEANNHNTS